MVICLERDADLHTAQLMPLSLTVSCFSIIQIGFTSSVLAHPGSPRKKAIKRVCVCVLLLTLPGPTICGKRLCNGRVSVRPFVCLSRRSIASKQRRRAAGLLQHERGRHISVEIAAGARVRTAASVML